MTGQCRFVVLAALLLVSTAVFCAQKSMRVNVDMVMVNVGITDRDNRPVINLGAENFQLFEDRVEQKIQSFTRETAPVSLGIIFDVSRSMGKKMDLARDAVARLVTRRFEQRVGCVSDRF